MDAAPLRQTKVCTPAANRERGDIPSQALHGLSPWSSAVPGERCPPAFIASSQRSSAPTSRMNRSYFVNVS